MESAEHPQVGLALRAGHRGPCPAQSHRVGLVGSDAKEVGEGVDLALSSLSKDLAEQAVAGSEVIDQHPARGVRGAGQRAESVGEPVLERVVGAGVEKSLLDLRLWVPSDGAIFSRNDRYVYCLSEGHPIKSRSW